MDTYQTMKAQLAATGLYSLKGNTIVDCELLSYAESLNPAAEALRELKRESFLSTASSYGLEQRERDCGLPSSGKTDSRRTTLLARGAVTASSFTKEALQAQLKSAGLETELEENIADRKIIVHFIKNPDCGKEETANRLEKIMPCHLTAELDYSTAS